MAFESEFLDCMPHKIRYTAPTTALDGYGNITYAATNSTFQGIAQYKNKLIRSQDGTEKMSTSQVIINATGVVRPEGLWYLPDSTGTPVPVLQVNRMTDEDGQHHVEVSFG
jgi:hypothetical protein